MRETCVRVQGGTAARSRASRRTRRGASTYSMIDGTFRLRWRERAAAVAAARRRRSHTHTHTAARARARGAATCGGRTCRATAARGPGPWGPHRGCAGGARVRVNGATLGSVPTRAHQSFCSVLIASSVSSEFDAARAGARNERTTARTRLPPPNLRNCTSRDTPSFSRRGRTCSTPARPPHAALSSAPCACVRRLPRAACGPPHQHHVRKQPRHVHAERHVADHLRSPATAPPRAVSTHARAQARARRSMSAPS